jgi:hypothetical protein
VPQQVERLSLRQWIGISGAAFTTGLGKGTSIAKSFLLGVANIRLGYWWDSYVEPRERRKEAPQDYVKGNLLYDFLSYAFPVQSHLFDELLARFRGPNSRLWYLSDGGHFENTGVYELIRRRVPLIIVCDCGCDPDYGFEDLAQLTRMARVDFGAEIEFLDKQALDRSELGAARELFGSREDFAAKGPKKTDESTESGERKGGKTLRGPHALLARVAYPGPEDETGGGGSSLLIVLKPSLSGDETLDVTQYHTAYPEFPQESTVDQFFDEAQWESYRKLGRHIGEQLFGENATTTWLKLAPQT